MIIRIIAVGRLRERHWQDAAADFARRLRPYTRLVVEEVAEARLKETAREKQALEEEAQAISERLEKHSGPVVVLERTGKALDSAELAAWMNDAAISGVSGAAFVIGGPLGLSPEVFKRADLLLSFSRMTFPHQMMRIMLLEQIYRSYRIMRGEPYHK
ncbi:MAG TPA: 23S rRNA (pseudouridine(1915)-N(3))-methyltransferase RlmH [Methanothrix sp.]|nr:23S rRNA (pseudouridine(1915)-N(3))-methyltransferase RlmH [Methanothrix sp.]HPC89868.1 23S rRNA (pseudouridine(1915)-N(3))-methyltransferase RlmH [Methanothrix sp.]